jgi:hypothetical protein
MGVYQREDRFPAFLYSWFIRMHFDYGELAPEPDETKLQPHELR